MKTLAYISSNLFFLVALALAQNQVPVQSSFKGMGAPNDPKVSMVWNRYYDSQELAEIGERIANAYPDLVSRSTIGESVQGWPLYLLTVTSKKGGKSGNKPGFYIDGNIHSNEIQGSEVALYTVWYLTESYGKIDWITELLDRVVFYIVPTINPDARDWFIHHPNTPHSPRSGMLPRDDDGDGLMDEDGYDDLDGDGNIVQMRKLDPAGRYIKDPDHPRMLKRAEPDQPGQYTLLGWEGKDNDGDGRINEDGPGYYDPNRNWAFSWVPEYIQYGSDQYPFSIPENRAVAEFVIDHPNIAGAQSYHNSGGMFVRGPGSKADTEVYTREDTQIYDFLAEKGEEILPFYRYVVLYKDMYSAVGGELDWLYGGRGIYTFTNELWSSLNMFKDENNEQGWFGRQKDVYRFDRLLLFGEGIVEWTPIDHPQYGKIEIGGVKKNWTRTAPSFLIEEMCHRNMAFTLFHADQMPSLAIDSVHVKELGDGLVQIDAIVHNRRIIPTRSDWDVKNGITLPDRITISGDGVQVITGFRVLDPFLKHLKEQTHHPETIHVESIKGMDTVQVRWIVTGNDRAVIRVDSVRGGVLVEEIEL